MWTCTYSINNIVRFNVNACESERQEVCEPVKCVLAIFFFCSFLRTKKWQASAVLSYRDMTHMMSTASDGCSSLIACLRWMMGYLIPTYSTQLLFTLLAAWGGSGGILWPYGEGGRARAEWSGAFCLVPAPHWLRLQRAMWKQKHKPYTHTYCRSEVWHDSV